MKSIISLNLTNYETLKTISQDSMFARNIMAIYCKPSLKIHYIENLIKNKYVDNNNCTTFLEASAK